MRDDLFKGTGWHYRRFRVPYPRLLIGYDHFDTYFHEISDRYSDGVNWGLVDLDGDGGVEILVTSRDETVDLGPDLEGLGRTEWLFFDVQCN